MYSCPYRMNGCPFQAETEEEVDEHVSYMVTVGDDEHKERPR